MGTLIRPTARCTSFVLSWLSCFVQFCDISAPLHCLCKGGHLQLLIRLHEFELGEI